MKRHCRLNLNVGMDDVNEGFPAGGDASGCGSLVLDNDEFFGQVSSLLAAGQRVTLRAQGNSMFPFIAGGRDSVVLQGARGAAVGDIVLARVPGLGYVVHRVYRVDGGWLLLMGDGNLHRTERCRACDVVGCVVRIVRGRRVVDCSSPAERMLAACWRVLLPVRRYLLWVARRCAAMAGN